MEDVKTETPDLLPCPFCGEAAIWVDEFNIQCSNASCLQPHVCAPDGDPEHFWNTRSAQAARILELEAEVAAAYERGRREAMQGVVKPLEWMGHIGKAKNGDTFELDLRNGQWGFVINGSKHLTIGLNGRDTFKSEEEAQAGAEALHERRARLLFTIPPADAKTLTYDHWPREDVKLPPMAPADAIAGAEQRDAERYRWLRSRDLDTVHKGGVFAGLTPDNVVLNGEDLDKHVDFELHAIRARGEGE